MKFAQQITANQSTNYTYIHQITKDIQFLSMLQNLALFPKSLYTPKYLSIALTPQNNSNFDS